MAMAMAIVRLVLVIALCMSKQMEAQQLEVGFYRNKCNAAEGIVKEEVKKAFSKNNGIAAGLIRMHFHDCFIRGCDGSVLIDSTPNNKAEKDGPPNIGSLRGFEVIDSAKARIEAACQGVVSCADILSFAARDAVVVTGGLGWDVPAGRRDGRVSLVSETRTELPPPIFNLDQLNQSFAMKGLTPIDMVVLSGAHTVGRSHCNSFGNRLYNFNKTQRPDPSLNPQYATALKGQCPIDGQGNIDPNPVVQMNISPAVMDNSYYSDILRSRGLFTSDQTLNSSLETSAKVREYAVNNLEWMEDFWLAMLKMSQIEVLTGTAGEIRSNCRKINP